MRPILGEIFGKKLSAGQLPGAGSVANILDEGSWRDLTEIWRLGFETRLDESGNLQRYLILDLANSRSLDETPLLRIMMLNPRECSIPDATQVFGLTVDDISEMGWDRLSFRLYDVEDTDLDVLCAKITLQPQPKPGC